MPLLAGFSTSKWPFVRSGQHPPWPAFGFGIYTYYGRIRDCVDISHVKSPERVATRIRAALQALGMNQK